MKTDQNTTVTAPAAADVAAADAARIAATVRFQAARVASEQADVAALRAAHALERERAALSIANDFYVKTYERQTIAQQGEKSPPATPHSATQAREKRIRQQFVSALRAEAKYFAAEMMFSPSKGFIYIYDDPFRWSASQSYAHEVKPGVYSVNLETGEIHRAEGGTAENGATAWKVFENAA